MNIHSLVYNLLFIPAAKAAVFILRLFVPKIKERESNAAKVFEALPDYKNKKVIWFHASSMGEFEQAKPIIELIKWQNPSIKIVCSFYSPSGYINQRNYEFADSVCYMLLDTKKNATIFINKINPSVAVFIRYDIWRNHLKSLKRNNIPAILINATYPNNKVLTDSIFFKQFTVSNYELFNEIITVNKYHEDKFRYSKVDTLISAFPDTRFDRILSKVSEAESDTIINRELLQDAINLVAGSTWHKDDELIAEAISYINKDSFKIRLIIAPHEPTLKNIESIFKKFPNCILLSRIQEQQNCDLSNRHIIIDSIGKLLKIYANADLVYVGGGFGAGVHSVAEPAGFGLPISCGKKYENSPDATALMKAGGVNTINNSEDLRNWLELMLEQTNRKHSGKINKKYLSENSGTSQIISEKILTILNQKQ